MAFATTHDVSARLGRSIIARDSLRYESALADAQAMIEAAVDMDEASMGTVHPMLRGLCVTVAIRIANNPEGLQRNTESLGDYSSTKSYAEGVALTEHDILAARRVVHGTNSSNGANS